jgi:hypothetical protein
MNLLWYRFRRDGIELPYPVQTVHLKEITAESRRLEHEHHISEVLALMGNVDILSPLPQDERRKRGGSGRRQNFRGRRTSGPPG